MGPLGLFLSIAAAALWARQTNRMEIYSLSGIQTTLWRSIFVFCLFTLLATISMAFYGIYMPSGEGATTYYGVIMLVAVIATYIDIKLIEGAGEHGGITFSAMISLSIITSYMFGIIIDIVWANGEEWNNLIATPFKLIAITACIISIAFLIKKITDPVDGTPKAIAAIRHFAPVILAMGSTIQLLKVAFDAMPNELITKTLWYPPTQTSVQVLIITVFLVWRKLSASQKSLNFVPIKRNGEKLPFSKWGIMIASLGILWPAVMTLHNWAIAIAPNNLVAAYYYAIIIGGMHLILFVIARLFGRESSIKDTHAWGLIATVIAFVFVTNM